MKSANRSTILASAGVLANFALSGHVPSRRALATLAKLHGRRLERRWPFLPRSAPSSLNLGFEDLLEFQYARRRSFFVMVIGVFDGVENDSVSAFVRSHRCGGIFVEPQPNAFERLRRNLGHLPNLRLVNAAIDRTTGQRVLFHLPAGTPGLPPWTEQLASFTREHLEKHEDRAPGLSRHVEATTVATLSFEDLLDAFPVSSIDVLQIDAEGADALLLSWFPFDRIKPAVVHYEIAHMSQPELRETRQRLAFHGYSVYPAASPLDEMAIAI